MKYLGNFDTLTQYQAALANGEIQAPNVSLVEGKCIYKPIAKTNFGDVAMYNSLTGKFEFSSLGAYSTTLYKKANLTAVGVVVVPADYTPDNTTRVMSLKNMSCKTPATGSAEVLQSGLASDQYDAALNMRWGANGDIPGITNTPTVNAVNPLTGEFLATTDWMRIPSEYLWRSQGYTDPITGYKYYYGPDDATPENDTSAGKWINDPSAGSYKRFGPYPLLKDGSKNELWFAEGMATNDFGGRANTNAILANTSVDWKSPATFDNLKTDAGYYPPVFCCSRYATKGTTAGDWYLPAQGELSFLIAKFASINNTLQTLETLLPGDSIRLSTNTSTYGHWLWSSSLHNSTNARYCNLDRGYVYYDSRSTVNTSNRVRAFMAL